MLGYIHQYYADIAGGASDEHVSSNSREKMRHCARKAIEADPDCAEFELLREGKR